MKIIVLYRDVDYVYHSGSRLYYDEKSVKEEDDLMNSSKIISVRKKLSEMSLEELWQLFPIYLTEHDEKWTGYYNEMEKVLKEKLSVFNLVRIDHIGSTAVKSIWAKPIVDIIVEIDTNENMNSVAVKIEECGLIKMNESEKRMTFNYGYTQNGFAQKVYHLHLRYKCDNDELYFRDYLIDNPEIAKKYESMKLQLWHQYEHNRDAYTYAKTEFINNNTQKAKQTYGTRYQ